MSFTETPAPAGHLLGFNAGYVDTAGFLALSGLFTAHVTGNFVTLGASLIHGTSGAWAKLSALPVFCVAVVLTRLLSQAIVARGQPVLGRLIVCKVVLLAAAAALMIALGPFSNGDQAPAFLAGMLMVAAMAIQNAMQRMHMKSAPPSTLMTGNTTQVMIDLADLFRGASGSARGEAVGRLRRMVPAIIAFAAGCAVAALAYVSVGMWCFALPPLVGLLTLPWLREPLAPRS
ncbi:DUF1275 domain-containing protein [Ottowia sp. GY511]|uniref:YoaK family protein n=1 Tax=Ottowia flava TaxID=2675430 RepID=A0ABW4KP85_9BURK|nr:YoaK family protein [Ottowia sp. GY511]TXK29616.1 DUF1275 domain-containing protein [Ottowia sp. GY511]